MIISTTAHGSHGCDTRRDCHLSSLPIHLSSRGLLVDYGRLLLPGVGQHQTDRLMTIEVTWPKELLIGLRRTSTPTESTRVRVDCDMNPGSGRIRTVLPSDPSAGVFLLNCVWPNLSQCFVYLICSDRRQGNLIQQTRLLLSHEIWRTLSSMVIAYRSLSV